MNFQKRQSGILAPFDSNDRELGGFRQIKQDEKYTYFEDSKGGTVKVLNISGGDFASADVVLVQAIADGATYTNSTTETSLLPNPAVFTLPANYFYVGRTLRVSAWGEIATGAGPGNLNFRVRYGSATTGIIIADTGAIAMTASIATKFIWSIEVLITCRALGSGTSGSLFGIGRATGMTSVTPPVISNMGSAGNATPAPAGIDTTTATTLQVTALSSVAVAATQLILHGFTLEAMN